MQETEWRVESGKLLPADNYARRIVNSNTSGTLIKLYQKTEQPKEDKLRTTWFKWMEVTAEWMAERGAKMPLIATISSKRRLWAVLMGQEGFEPNSVKYRPFSKDDAHELFTAQWMGEDPQGRRYSWSQKPESGCVPADKGMKLHAMDKHMEWSNERGLYLPTKRTDEYYKLSQQMRE